MITNVHLRYVDIFVFFSLKKSEFVTKLKSFLTKRFLTIFGERKTCSRFNCQIEDEQKERIKKTNSANLKQSLSSLT